MTYRDMYFKLFAAMSDAIDELAKLREKLCCIQSELDEIYISELTDSEEA